MSEWKKIVTSGSDASLADVTVDNLTITPGGTFINPNDSATSTYSTSTTANNQITSSVIYTGDNVTQSLQSYVSFGYQNFSDVSSMDESTDYQGIAWAEGPGASSGNLTDSNGNIADKWIRDKGLTGGEVDDSGDSNGTGPNNGPIVTPSGDTADQDVSDSYYVYTEASSGQWTANDRSLFRTKALTINMANPDMIQLRGYFHAMGSDIGPLRIFASTDPDSCFGATELSYTYYDGTAYSNGPIASSVQTDIVGPYHQFIVDILSINNSGTYYIFFEHARGSSYLGDFAISSLSVKFQLLTPSPSSNKVAVNLESTHIRKSLSIGESAIGSSSGAALLNIVGDDKRITFDASTKWIGDHSIDGLEIRTSDEDPIALKVGGNKAKLVVASDHIKTKVPMKGLMPFILTPYFYHDSSTAFWLPFAGTTPSTGQQPLIKTSLVAPYDGRIVRISFNFDNNPGITNLYFNKNSGNYSTYLYSDQAGWSPGSGIETITIAPPTSEDYNASGTLNYANLTGGFAKNDYIAIKLDPANSPGWTSVTLVLEYDTNS